MREQASRLLSILTLLKVTGQGKPGKSGAYAHLTAFFMRRRPGSSDILSRCCTVKHRRKYYYWADVFPYSHIHAQHGSSDRVFPCFPKETMTEKEHWCMEGIRARFVTELGRAIPSFRSLLACFPRPLKVCASTRC